ncbi:Do family protease [Hyphomonas polymorpha PS728]|uniref:Do family protease n=1 Tax=Hyphomonas polymorpha PS728 TaxID=1280954 RepID=A0A062VN41_9PROT|nr:MULTISPECIES: Do family serine endopeptidase [Hyphomonas]AXE66186.1 Do family protease [Hyphomonas sp. CACIAM 19H1]KDA00145.1 Do family protease [Hyphomonas polymorpha PS728]
MNRTAVAVIALMALMAPATFAQTAGSLSRPGAPVDAKTAPQSFSALSKRLMPAVVNISTSQVVASRLPSFPEGSPAERFNEYFGRNDDGFQRQGSLGSGFVISADGYIVTNNHVIDKADTIEVTFSDGRTLDAKIIGRDRDTDIAVLKVTSRTPLPFVDLGDSDRAEVGDWVIAIGNPLGFGGSVSAGIISATGRDLNTGRSDNFIQTDAAINQGNSGGPLFNLNGQVVGVNTAIISQSGGSIGLGFSVPSNTVKRISAQLIKEGRVHRPWLGVNVQDADESLIKAYRASGKSGTIVTRITDGSPAAKAKLEVGDLILSIDGRAVAGVRDMTRQLSEKPIGKAITLSIVRDGRQRDVAVTLGELPDEDVPAATAPSEAVGLSNDLGADLVALDDDVRRRFGAPRDMTGVAVTGVSTRGRAYNKLRRGDVIVEVNFQSVSAVSDVLKRLDTAMQTPNQPILIRVKRRGDTGGWFDQFVSIEIRK